MSKTEPKTTVEWNKLNWRKIQKAIFKLQKRIYRAYISGNVRKGRRLQKTLINSYYNRLLAVRKVTQENSGKNTAGVDKVKSLTPKQRLKFAEDLKLGEKSKPIRRIWIPKPGKNEKRCSAVLGVSPMSDCIKKRPLGIPVMRDRAVQALAKAVLEPEWEAKFEPNSYGFRPGRSAHDAISSIFNYTKSKPKYVLDADISKCFDQINHHKLLTKIDTFPKMRKQIKAWLKADIVDYVKHERTPNHQGTPQGGVLSPLLSNIALHGLENRIKQTRGLKEAAVIRYADDFVVLHPKLEKVQKCQTIIEEWLNEYGLELSAEKTRITHTLDKMDDIKPGFDFLGFNIRQYPAGKHHSAKNTKGKPLGFKTIIKPSDKSVKRHYQELSDTIKRLNAAPQVKLIKELNPIIRGWCNYFKTVCSKETFTKLQHLAHKRLRRWADRRHPNKSKHWVSNKYWKTVKNDKRVFKTTGKYETELLKHSKEAITRHTKVIGEESPYNGDTLYWGERMSNHPEIKKSLANLLKKRCDPAEVSSAKERAPRQQRGICNWCGLSFQEREKLEKDHIIPVKAGGSNKRENFQLLHKHCHDEKTRDDLKAIKAYKQEKEWQKLTKWFDNQNWTWVDDIPTLINGHGTHKEPDYRGAQ